MKVMLVSSKFFTSPPAAPTANRSYRDFSPHHRNHGTAFFTKTFSTTSPVWKEKRRTTELGIVIHSPVSACHTPHQYHW